MKNIINVVNYKDSEIERKAKAIMMLKQDVTSKIVKLLTGLSDDIITELKIDNQIDRAL